MRTLCFMLLFIGLTINFKAQTAEALMESVVNKINSVKDYKADINIKAEIPYIKVPLAKATIYFKQKDKFKVISKGIAILPKQGMSDVSSFLSNDKKYTAVLGAKKEINGEITNLVTVIPNSENGEIILAKVFIQANEELIYRTVLTTKSSGTVTIDYEYGQNKKYGLPSKIVFTVDVKKFKMPKSVSSDMRNTEPKDKKPKTKGTITITFLNYEVNKGISDDFFKKD